MPIACLPDINVLKRYKRILPVRRVMAVPAVSLTNARIDTEIFAEKLFKLVDTFHALLDTLGPCMIPWQYKHVRRAQEAYLPQASFYAG